MSTYTYLKERGRLDLLDQPEEYEKFLRERLAEVKRQQDEAHEKAKAGRLEKH